MAALNTNLPPVLESDDTSPTRSPARGRETTDALLKILRPPPLHHTWNFWHEKPKGPTSTFLPLKDTTLPANEQSASTTTTMTETATSSYDPRFSMLLTVADIRIFWSLFNNISFTDLAPGTAVHLFHKCIMPQWEDPRNIHGGCWTFRIPHDTASGFFRCLALFAIGERLQQAITVVPERMTFRDDICGISFVVKNMRYTNVQIWNRDAENEGGIQRVLDCILDGVPAEVKPQEGQYYYKKHKDHAGFNAAGNATATS